MSGWRKVATEYVGGASARVRAAWMKDAASRCSSFHAQRQVRGTVRLRTKRG